MGRLLKIQVSKVEDEIARRLTINAVDEAMYLADGWAVETEPYMDKPVDDKIEAHAGDKIEAHADDKVEAPVDDKVEEPAEEIKAVVDEDLLID